MIHRALQRAGHVPVARVLVYLAQALRYRVRHGGPLPWTPVLAGYPRWRNTQVQPTQPLADGLPWITYGAIEFLDSRLHSAMRAFEFGSGGSTIFIAPRVGELVSVEHDGAWVRQVKEATARLGLVNATLLHVELPIRHSAATARDPDAYASTDVLCRDKDFRTYASVIDRYPEGGFDFILIDGRARPSCFQHALPKLAPGGVIMLDNAERAHYAYIRDTLDGLGWKRLDFAGAGPYNQYFWRTSVWIRPGDAARGPGPAETR